jgi:hypothetical protein
LARRRHIGTQAHRHTCIIALNQAVSDAPIFPRCLLRIPTRLQETCYYMIHRPLTRQTSLTFHAAVAPADSNIHITLIITAQTAVSLFSPQALDRPNRLGFSTQPPLASFDAAHPLHQLRIASPSLRRRLLPTILRARSPEQPPPRHHKSQNTLVDDLLRHRRSAPPRPREIMGSYTFRWYVTRSPAVPPFGKDASSASAPRRVRSPELGSSWLWWSYRPAGYLVVQCYATHAHAHANLRPHSKHTLILRPDR